MKSKAIAKSGKIGIVLLLGTLVSMALFVAAAIGLSRALESDTFDVAEQVDENEDLF